MPAPGPSGSPADAPAAGLPASVPAPVVWITGAGGLIGSHLAQTARLFLPGWRVVALTRRELDLADLPALTRAFHADCPALVIHAAALSRAAACQADPALATRLNVGVTRHLSELAAGVSLLFLSTDLVFDGRKGHYDEHDPVHPLSVYSETKVAAEQHVMRNPAHTVVRLALNTGVSPTGDRSFTEVMRHAWARGETVPLFADEYRCPIPAVVTARAIWELAIARRPGLYHLGGSERLSRWAIGQLVAAREPGSRARIQSTSLRDFAGPCRPADTSLNCARIQAVVSFPLPGLRQWITDHPSEPI